MPGAASPDDLSECQGFSLFRLEPGFLGGGGRPSAGRVSASCSSSQLEVLALSTGSMRVVQSYSDFLSHAL